MKIHLDPLTKKNLYFRSSFLKNHTEKYLKIPPPPIILIQH